LLIRLKIQTLPARHVPIQMREQPTDDAGTKEALLFLMTRKTSSLKAFVLGLESLGNGPFEIGGIPPTKGLLDQYFNDSTGEGADGEIDARGS
jgi:Mn-containing catalase